MHLTSKLYAFKNTGNHADIPVKQHNMGKGWKLVTGSATKNEGKSTVGGVGMLISPNAGKSLINIETINPRIVIATFNGNPQTTIISCYSPTNAFQSCDNSELKCINSDMILENTMNQEKLVNKINMP